MYLIEFLLSVGCLQQVEENHNAEVRVYSQKVRHLEYEHSNNMREIDEAAHDEYKQEDQYHGR